MGAGMGISDWLDMQEAARVDVSNIALPEELAFDAVPDETVFFKTYNPCSILCAKEHPFATVERYGRWYWCRGQDRKAGSSSGGGSTGSRPAPPAGFWRGKGWSATRLPGN
jgi:hypothetical protein